MCLMHHRPDAFVIEKHFGDDPATLVICFLVCAGRCDVFDASQT